MSVIRLATTLLIGAGILVGSKLALGHDYSWELGTAVVLGVVLADTALELAWSPRNAADGVIGRSAIDPEMVPLDPGLVAMTEPPTPPLTTRAALPEMWLRSSDRGGAERQCPDCSSFSLRHRGRDPVESMCTECGRAWMRALTDDAPDIAVRPEFRRYDD